MKRKVNLVGQSTLTVSLPSKWAKKYGLKAGDEVEVTEEDFNLIVGAKTSEKLDKIHIKLVSTNDWYVKQIIRNAYMAGYDEVEVTFDDPDVILEVQKTVDVLLGYEIIEQSQKGCLIRNLSVGVEGEFDVLLRKVFLLSFSMFDLMIEDFSANKIDNYPKQQDINRNTHRFATFCRRMINKKHLFPERVNIALYITLQRLNMMTHNMVYTYDYLATKKKFTIKKETVNFIKKVKELFDLFYKSFYSGEISNLAKISHERWRLVREEMFKIMGSDEVNSVVCHFVSEILRLIAATGGSLFTYISSMKKTH